MRVCVSVCVSLLLEISGTRCRIATLLTTSWKASPGQLHKLLFEHIRRAVREKKPLNFFRQLRAEFRAYTVILPVTLGKMNLAHYNTAFGTFSKGMRWRTRPPLHEWRFTMCSLAYTTRGSREKAFGSFSPVTWRTVTLPVTLGRMNLAHYKKAFGRLS